MRHVTVILTPPQAEALKWAGNIGLEEARSAGMKAQTIEAACKAIEALVRAMGLIPYRRNGAVHGRKTTRENHETQH